MRILRGLGSRTLPCGCVAGIYETYAGRTVVLLDSRVPGCRNPQHRPGRPLDQGRNESAESRVPDRRP
jgi:hypothetical protein